MKEIVGTLADRRIRKAKLDRRSFLRFSATLAGACAAGPALVPSAKAVTTGAMPPDPIEGSENVEIRYTVCLMCHSACGLRVKVHDGVIAKIDGNPYHPNNMEPYERIAYDTKPEDAIWKIGRVCSKPQAYAETVYSPYRLRGPLKRVGKRGEGKWRAISWDQALDEIAAKLKEYRSFEPIDPNLPELGPKANQVVFSPGRYEHGQKEFTDRWFKNCYGTINYRHDHTSICEESHHIAKELMTEGKKNHFKPDISNAKFIIWFGTNPLEANFPAQTLGRKLMDFIKRGGKMAVVDPRFSHTAAKAKYWIPAKPATDGAVAMALARWIVDNEKYDKKFLSATTKEGAAKVNELTWTDATYLVNQQTGKFVRPADVGLPGGEDDYVVSAGGELKVHSSVDAADLMVSTTVNDQPVKSVFQMVVERLRERTIEEYAAIAGVNANDLKAVAAEFAAAGKQAIADFYRGSCQNTHGVYASMAIVILNMLVGNFDWKGGYIGGGSHWHETNGGGKPGTVDIMKVPNGVSAKGIQITRAKASYEKDAPNLFARDGYPAKRPWFPHASNGVYQELMPSIYDQYPYPVKALIAYWNGLPYSTPAQKAIFEKTAADESKLPLFVVFDIEMGPAAEWADYVLPDTSILERWSTPHVSPAIPTKTSGFRQPVIGRFDGKPWNAPFDPNAKNDYQPVFPGTRVIEDIFIDLGKRIGLPGIGENAFEDGSPLHNAWDWYGKIARNFAIESGWTVDDVIRKGGVFDPPDKAYTPDGKAAKAFGKIIHFYVEKLAQTIDSMTGKRFEGLFKWEPPRDAIDRIVDDSAEYPFRLVTYKNFFHAMARTAVDPSLMAIRPTNFVEMNASDGRALGLETGDPVRVVSPNGAIEENAVVFLSEGIRPGVVAVAHSYGHWSLSARPFYINGKRTAFDATRGAGITANPIMRVDPYLGNVSLQDKIGGSASFQETQVRIEKLNA